MNKNKKGLPSNFVLFLIAAVLLVLMLQNLMDTKFAKISFSYQLEPLVNLELIQPEESRKTAINDNLVSFSGKFRDRYTEEGKGRYKYLELLNRNHELGHEKRELQDKLSLLKKKINDSTAYFLQLSGIRIPQDGYAVVDDIYGPAGKNFSVVVTQAADKRIETFPELESAYQQVSQSPTKENTAQFRGSLIEFIQNMRSPALGIGNEAVKQQLRDMQAKVANAKAANLPEQKKLELYGKQLNGLKKITQDLDQKEGRIRLDKLRSVRNYRTALDEYNKTAAALEDNKAQLDKTRQKVGNVVWFFNNQELSTRALEKQDLEKFGQWFTVEKEEWDNFPANRGAYFKAPDQPLNKVLEKTFRSEEPPPKYLSYMFPAMIAFAVVIVLYLLFARQMRGMGSGAMNFGKSPARLIMPKGDDKITFKDVAGVEEALEELEELVDFLKDPKKFTSLGGRIPKGVLCVGAPGTGKTLIARAVAGEADRPFFSISGSDFVEMFVGVGASRIRDLFDQAKKHAPCIIFIDEIDAVGRHRGAGIGGGHDEREQTLNQLLVEMDGFVTNEGVILIAATNRPDVLDKALLRPGRFDRRIIINLPDIKGRYEILKVHAKKIKMDTNVNLMDLAKGTAGCSGADLSNMLNEAALLAARKGRTAVTHRDVMEARDKVLYGKERRSLELDENEKLTTSYHESGHAVVSVCVEHSDPIDKVTIIPRGMALGVTMFLPEKNKVSYWKKELIDRLAVLMGGRCAEEVFLGDISSGAQQDFEQATHLARSMVCEWGMSEALGHVAYDEHSETSQYLGMNGAHEKRYSEATAQEIDNEVRRIVEEAHGTALRIVQEHREQIELMTKMLMEFETLDRTDVQKIVEGSWQIDEKKFRVKAEEEMHKKAAPKPPPPPPIDAIGPHEGPAPSGA